MKRDSIDMEALITAAKPVPAQRQAAPARMPGYEPASTRRALVVEMIVLAAVGSYFLLATFGIFGML